MAFLEYMLLALLGSASATPAGTLARTFTADAVTQPGAGAEGEPGSIGTGRVADYNHGKMDSRHHTKTARHHRRTRKGRKVYEKATRNATVWRQLFFPFNDNYNSRFI